MEPSETIIRNDLNLGIEVEVGDALANLYTPITIDMTEMEVKSILPLSFDISLETQISSISELFSQDTDTEFSVNCFKDTKINGSGTEAYIDLNNSAILDTGYKHATVAQDLPRTDGTLGWTGLDTIAIDNRYIIGQTNTTGSNKSTRLLSTFGFGHNIPSDAFITGIKVLIAADSSQPGGTTAYCRIKTNTETSDTKTASAPQGWSQVTFGGNTAIWGLDARGSNVNGDNLRVELYFGPINNNHRVQIDWVNIEFSIEKDQVVLQRRKLYWYDNMVLKWDKFTYNLVEPVQGTVRYDVFRENIDQQQIGANTNVSVGSTNYNSWLQIFKPTNSNLTGIGVWAMGKVGNPGPLKAKVYTLSGSVPDILLGEYTFPSWGSNVEQLACFDINNLNTSTSYGFLLTTNSFSSDNYYWIRINSLDRYTNGKARYKRGTTWTDYSGDLYFKTYYPVNILTNQQAIDLSNINYSEIKIRGRLSTSILGQTPKIDSIHITKQEIIEG